MVASSGHLTTINATGTPTSFTTEACSYVTGDAYRIDDGDKSIWDPRSSLSIYDNGSLVPRTSIASVDYLFGKVVFASGYSVSRPVTVSGYYLPTYPLIRPREMSLTISAEMVDATSYGSPVRKAHVGLDVVSGTLGSIDDGTEVFDGASASLSSYIKAGQLFVLEFLIGSAQSALRTFAVIDDATASASPIDVVNQTLRFSGITQLSLDRYPVSVSQEDGATPDTPPTITFTDSYEDVDGWTSSSSTSAVPSQWDLRELGSVSPAVVRQANPTADAPPNPLTTTGAYCRRTNTNAFGTSYLLIFGVAASEQSGAFVAISSANTITTEAYLRCNVYSTPSGSDMSAIFCKTNLDTRDGYYLGIGNESGTFGLTWRVINGASTSYTLIKAITNNYWYGVRFVCYQSGTSDILEAYLEDPAEGGSWVLEDTKTITAADPLKRAWSTSGDRVGWYGVGQFVNNYVDAFNVQLS